MIHKEGTCWLTFIENRAINPSPDFSEGGLGCEGTDSKKIYVDSYRSI